MEQPANSQTTTTRVNIVLLPCAALMTQDMFMTDKAPGDGQGNTGRLFGQCTCCNVESQASMWEGCPSHRAIPALRQWMRAPGVVCPPPSPKGAQPAECRTCWSTMTELSQVTPRRVSFCARPQTVLVAAFTTEVLQLKVGCERGGRNVLSLLAGAPWGTTPVEVSRVESTH
jgi:hypothetical protein